MRSKLDHQTGQTVNLGTMTSHPHIVPVKFPLDNVVPLPQSGHQGLVVVGKELKVLPILTELSLQTIILKMPPCQQSLIAQASRQHTLSLSLANITQSLIATADECLIDSIKAVIVTLYPSLLSRIPIWISLINSDLADDKFRLRNCSSIIPSIAND